MKVKSLDEMLEFGARIGARIGARARGGEVLELIGDVGAGKTTFTKGLARGMGVTDSVQSPTFTISREYDAREGLRLVHYDFYRLGEAGIMEDELAESLADPKSVVVVEWAETVTSVLPKDSVTVTISLAPDDENSREIAWSTGGEVSRQLMEGAL